MYLIVRAVVALMMSAGVGALAAALFVMYEPSPEWTRWILPIRHIALAIGIPFLVAAVLASALLRRDAARAVGGRFNDPLSALGLLPLAFLAIVALWQAPVVLTWWGESQRLIQQITAGERDPLGFWILPAIIISTPPVVAALVILIFSLGTIASATALPASRARLLAACIVLAAGLIISSGFVLSEVRALGAQLLAVMDGHSDTVEAAAAMVEAGARHDSLASTLLGRFRWILIGYGVALAAAVYGRRPATL